jgi:hypothetical protein
MLTLQAELLQAHSILSHEVTFLGIVSTAWSGAGAFLKEFYQKDSGKNIDSNSVSNTFRAVFPKP